MDKVHGLRRRPGNGVGAGKASSPSSFLLLLNADIPMHATLDSADVAASGPDTHSNICRMISGHTDPSPGYGLCHHSDASATQLAASHRVAASSHPHPDPQRSSPRAQACTLPSVPNVPDAASEIGPSESTSDIPFPLGIQRYLGYAGEPFGRIYAPAYFFGLSSYLLPCPLDISATETYSGSHCSMHIPMHGVSG